MTQSLPAQDASSASRRDAILNAVAGLTLRALPRIPNAAKRALLGGRSVTVDGNTLDTTLQLMLAAQRAAGMDGLVGSDDVGIARAQVRTLQEALKKVLPVAGVANLTIPGPAGPIAARHYRPEGTAARLDVAAVAAPLLVFFHGGGWVIGDIETHDDLCRLICRDGGVHVLSVDYRLAPEHKAPAAVEDAFAAYRWALEHAAELGADPARVAVGGDSAGGNLAAVVSQQARNEGVPLPALQLLIYPATNMASETRSRTLFAAGYFLTKRDIDWFSRHYFGGAGIGPEDPRISPLLADDLTGLSPALVLTGGFDPLRDEGNQYAEALRAAGVPVDLRQYGSLIHAFANMFPLGGGSAAAVADMVSGLRAHLARM